jgi:23S rRNA pseudouridine1911/1915/1917 synthase
MKLDIIYEDNHLIAVNKKPGILSQRDIRNIPSLIEYIKEYIRKKYSKPGEVFLGTVHRLDRSVSGLIVFARTSKAARRLQSEMLKGEMKKFYIAIIHTGKPVPGGWHTMEDRLLKVHGGSLVSSDDTDRSKTARLSYFCVENFGSQALVCINLQTGRKHQIRSQFASRGMPIVGDGKYGSPEPDETAICLHSFFLRFRHPTRDEHIELVTDIPERFRTRLPSTADYTEKIIDIIRKFLLMVLPDELK